MRSSRSWRTLHATGGDEASHLEMPCLCREAMGAGGEAEAEDTYSWGSSGRYE